MQEISGLVRRCPLCYGSSHRAAFGNYFICNLCTLAFRDGYAGGISLTDYRNISGRFVFPNWNNAFSRLTGRLVGHEPLYFTLPAVEMLAARMRCYASQAATILSSLGPKITAMIGDLPPPSPQTLALGMIASRDCLDDLCALVADTAPFVNQAVVVLDSTDQSVAEAAQRRIAGYLDVSRPFDLRVVAHPLGENFAAQRNRVQAMATTDWVLQLDTDERLTDATKRLLGRIIAAACLKDWAVIGIARRNMVDNVMADLYPDAQYRLLRADIRFTRAVHEYPVVKDGRQSFLFLGAEMLHAIPSARLRAREERYEGILPGGARPSDTRLLRTPFASSFELPSL